MSIRLKDTIYDLINNSSKLNSLEGDVYMQYKTATIPATAGWYRIAQTSSGISNNLGIFHILASTSSYHTNVTLSVGTSYGNSAGTTIQQISCSTYSNPNLTKARIVYNTTYSGNYAYLEVYHSVSSTNSISVKFQGHGWQLIAPNTAGSIPSGYSNKEITFAKNAMIATSFKGNADTATKLETARTISLTGSVTGSGSFDGSGNLSIATTTNHSHSTLTIQGNGTSLGTYNGSAAKTFNITYSNVGAAAALHNHNSLYVSALGTSGNYVTWTKNGTTNNITVPYATNSDTVDSWHKDYFRIGYDGSRHYRVQFGLGSEDLNWKTIVQGSSTYTEAPTSNAWQALTIRGDIWYTTNNHSGGQLIKYPFCAIFYYVSAKSLINNAYLYLPIFAKSYDVIRIVRVSTNNFELQVRQDASWRKQWIDYQCSWSGGTVNAYTSLQTANSGTVVVSASGASTITESYASYAYDAGTLDSLDSTAFMRAQNANGYYGLVAPGGANNVWIRTTINGIIPYQSGGSGSLGTSSWPFNAAYATTFYGSLSGNASTASKAAQLTTARTLTIGSTGKSFNGTANVSWTLAEIGAAASSHTHNYAGSNTSAGKAYDLYGHSGNPGSHNNVGVRWFTMSSTNSGSSGYAGTNAGFPVSNNANGMLWLGNHSGPYGGQLGISSNGRLYYRFISNGSFPTTANGGSWNRIAWTGDLSSYVTVSGTQTISGKKTFSGGAAITSASENTSMPFFLGIDAFADGGTIKYISKGSVCSCIGAAAASHTHSYIPLSGGTLSSGTARISRAGSSVSWYQGRSNAMMYISSYSGYNAIASMKTTNGDWSIGVYSSNYMYFTYITDTNYNSGTNTTTCQFIFRPDGYIQGNLSGYATSAGNADTVDSHHFSTVSALPSSPNANTVYFIV